MSAVDLRVRELVYLPYTSSSCTLNERERATIKVSNQNDIMTWSLISATPHPFSVFHQKQSLANTLLSNPYPSNQFIHGLYDLVVGIGLWQILLQESQVLVRRLGSIGSRALLGSSWGSE